MGNKRVVTFDEDATTVVSQSTPPITPRNGEHIGPSGHKRQYVFLKGARNQVQRERNFGEERVIGLTPRRKYLLAWTT